MNTRAIPPREREYALTVRQVLALRKQQARYRAIAETPGIRESARQAAQREIARIEGEIRG